MNLSSWAPSGQNSSTFGANKAYRITSKAWDEDAVDWFSFGKNSDGYFNPNGIFGSGLVKEFSKRL